jgi:hypothetical protein
MIIGEGLGERLGDGMVVGVGFVGVRTGGGAAVGVPNGRLHAPSVSSINNPSKVDHRVRCVIAALLSKAVTLNSL